MSILHSIVGCGGIAKRVNFSLPKKVVFSVFGERLKPTLGVLEFAKSRTTSFRNFISFTYMW